MKRALLLCLALAAAPLCGFAQGTADAAKAYIEFALSPAAREAILEFDFIPY